MTRVAVALALALLVQGAFATPLLYNCGCPAPITTLPAGVAYDAAPALGVNAAYPTASLDAASTLPTPVGCPQIVDTSAGPATSFSTGPFCKTSTFEVPVQSKTNAVSGPVAESTSVLEGYCSTSCAATRAKCGGTTKNVSFRAPTVINKGSRTSSSIAPVGNAVTTRSTKAGTPLVSTQVVPGPFYGPVPVAGPAPAPLCSDSYSLSADPATTFVAALNSEDPGSTLVPQNFFGLVA